MIVQKCLVLMGVFYFFSGNRVVLPQAISFIAASGNPLPCILYKMLIIAVPLPQSF